MTWKKADFILNRVNSKHNRFNLNGFILIRSHRLKVNKRDTWEMHIWFHMKIAWLVEIQMIWFIWDNLLFSTLLKTQICGNYTIFWSALEWLLSMTKKKIFKMEMKKWYSQRMASFDLILICAVFLHIFFVNAFFRRFWKHICPNLRSYTMCITHLYIH